MTRIILGFSLFVGLGLAQNGPKVSEVPEPLSDADRVEYLSATNAWAVKTAELHALRARMLEIDKEVSTLWEAVERLRQKHEGNFGKPGWTLTIQGVWSKTANEPTQRP